MKLKYLATSVFSFLMTGCAFGADFIKSGFVIINPAFTWAGPFVGGSIGYENSHYKTDKISMSHDLGIIGLYAGYNFSFGSGVTGLSAKTSYAFDPHKRLSKQDDATTKDEFLASIRARFGYAINHFLPYVSGGFSYRLDNVKDTLKKPGQDLVGYNFGLGVDYAITRNVLTTFEFQYSRLKMRKAIQAKLKVDSNEIHLGVAYKY